MSGEAVREIQLTGKQIVFLFVSIVAVAVVVFLLGVAVGRGVRGAVSDAPISADAGQTPEATTPPANEPSVLTYDQLLRGTGSGTPASSEGSKPADPPTPPKETAPPPQSATAEKPANATGDKPQAATQPAPRPVAPPPSTTGEWFLQIGAYRTRERANEIAAELKKLTFPAFVLTPTQGDPVNLFRVRVGPYGDRADAEQVHGRLVKQGYGPKITR